MPVLDYALLCDYVRAEVGVAHVISAGIDTVYKDEVPSGQNVGLLIRIGFARTECGRPHRLEVIFQDEDGERLAQIAGVINPEWHTDLPPNWKVGALMGLNFGVPLPRYGLYSFEVLINDNHMKTLPWRALPPAEAEDTPRAEE